MPRTLPWLAEAAAKKETARAAAKPKPKAAARSSSSPGDLVGSDLEDLDDDEPARSPRPKKKMKKVYRAPSSSPPPVVKEPPPTVLMNPGYTADDKWMMVEDEFYSTAQLWTQHLHQQEYARLKKLHRSRGQDTLDSLARGTDGRTKQSKQVQLKIQADEMAKRRTMAMSVESGDEEEEEDDFMFDPQLAGLMTGSSQRNAVPPSKLVRTKSRLAMAEDGDESSEPLPEPDLSAVEEEQEQEDEEETDSDDLDAPKPKPPTRAERKLLYPFASSSSGPKQSPPRIFRQLARPSIERRRPLKGDSPPSSPPPRLPAPVRERPKPSRPVPSLVTEPTFDQITAKQRRSPSPVAKPQVMVKDENGPRASSFLAKRRAQKEKEAAEARRKEIEDSIPAFFF